MGASDPAPAARGRFATTRWSIVRAAADQDSPAGDEALATLCQTYWYPVYAHIRRKCRSADQAQELTQEFFARLLERRALRAADADRGRFRSFLRACVDHFLINAHERDSAARRGGGTSRLSLDFRDAEQRLAVEPEDATTPEQEFERRWALALLDQVAARLEAEYAGDRASLFRELRPCLTRDGESAPYREIASRLRMSEGAVKVAAHRLRLRFGALLREEIAQTVGAPEAIDEEIRGLFQALAR